VKLDNVVIVKCLSKLVVLNYAQRASCTVKFEVFAFIEQESGK